MALGQLVNGQWTKEWTERNESGSFNECRLNFVIKLLLIKRFQGRTDATTFTFRWLSSTPHRVALKLKGLEEVVFVDR